MRNITKHFGHAIVGGVFASSLSGQAALPYPAPSLETKGGALSGLPAASFQETDLLLAEDGPGFIHTIPQIRQYSSDTDQLVVWYGRDVDVHAMQAYIEMEKALDPRLDVRPVPGSVFPGVMIVNKGAFEYWPLFSAAGHPVFDEENNKFVYAVKRYAPEDIELAVASAFYALDQEAQLLERASLDDERLEQHNRAFPGNDLSDRIQHGIAARLSALASPADGDAQILACGHYAQSSLE